MILGVRLMFGNTREKMMRFTQSRFPFLSRASKRGFSSIFHRRMEQFMFSMDEGRCQTRPYYFLEQETPERTM